MSGPVGLTRDAGWQIGVSRTVERSAEEVWRFLTSPDGIAIWLGEGVASIPDRGSPFETTAGVRGETRSLHELDRVRLTWRPRNWDHDTTLQLVVRSAGAGRARITVHQERLADAAERELQRGHWKGVVAALGDALLVSPASRSESE
ncbi:uncharacterized protein YndB with AHSA1/START domain [Diaminobutyricimonas aerilata]|uniref:Uncharacterized protein YndB with AHSA1/START domain n=1 Tax=Diaminobutyricimonas aerilata TaxID=1162967 RepID=A0A2M9CJZ9_9MICO|nr:SRPBCC domain-containing protein [Diaminobutyricimonas aerilata]PJJ72200.1 uncharacterized protein YndB with AHSA1/START domain [Diaminobutyricimonas aerilata]